MTANRRSVIVITAIQYFSLIFGCLLGFAVHYRVNIPENLPWVVIARVLQPHVLGCLTTLAFLGESLRFWSGSELRQSHPLTPVLSLALSFYAIFIMLDEPFFDYQGDETFLVEVLLLFPFLMSIGPLLRSQAWIAVTSAVLFFSNGLSMLIFNGCSRGGETDFFQAFLV